MWSDYYDAKSYDEEVSLSDWYNNYDENNPFDLYERGLITYSNFVSMMEDEKNRQEKFNKRKRIAEQICKE